MTFASKVDICLMISAKDGCISLLKSEFIELLIKDTNILRNSSLSMQYFEFSKAWADVCVSGSVNLSSGIFEIFSFNSKTFKNSSTNGFPICQYVINYNNGYTLLLENVYLNYSTSYLPDCSLSIASLVRLGLLNTSYETHFRLMWIGSSYSCFKVIDIYVKELFEITKNQSGMHTLVNDLPSGVKYTLPLLIAININIYYFKTWITRAYSH